MNKIVLCSFLILVFISSCGGESKQDLRDQIHDLQEQIEELQSQVEEKDEEISELKEKLDNARSHAEDVQSALDDGSFSDAYDCADDVISETDY